MGDPGIPGGPGRGTAGGTGGGSFGGPAGVAPGAFLPSAGAPPHRGALPIGDPRGDTLDLNQLQLFGGQWVNLKFDRPVILWPQFNVSGAAPPTVSIGSMPVIYYAPGRQIPASGSTANAQVSKGHGIVYLPKAGRWNLFYSGATHNPPAQNSWCVVTVIDASDPAVASRYLFEAGCHRISFNGSVAGITIADAILLPANRNRVGVWMIVESTNTNRARLGFGAPAVNNSGFQLAGNAASPTAQNGWTMSGDLCFKGDIHAIRDSTAVADVTIQVVEWE